ncbi:MAG: hypothetical protein N3I86_04635 [Verrucomicrobiae bacterium]|nr:hypothetical protein [Verrucomicrobiae bacterium]
MESVFHQWLTNPAAPQRTFRGGVLRPAGLALLVVLKIALDVRAHRRERKKLARPATTAN